jgi:methionyl-tRNA formyltransferase
MNQPLNIIFMGTPHFAVPALEALVKSHHSVIAVYSQPPRPSGRGQKMQESPVHQCATKYSIPVYTPKTLKSEDAQKDFAALKADIAVVAAYGLILPKKILETPEFGCLNIHASLLPHWRGASPIQHAIWMGDKESGVTIMQMNEGLDTGDILIKSTTPITAQTTSTDLQNTLSTLGSSLILTILDNIKNQTPEKQNNAASNYAPMLKKEDGQINWQSSAIEIDRQIRALNPWPGTYTTINKTRLKILEAKPVQGSGGKTGILENREGYVSCAQGVLQILKLQPEGGKPMDTASAINGGYLKIGDIFS